jgi:hypothetical protein
LPWKRKGGTRKQCKQCRPRKCFTKRRHNWMHSILWNIKTCINVIEGMPIAHVVFIIMGVVFGISVIARCYVMCCRPKGEGVAK